MIIITIEKHMLDVAHMPAMVLGVQVFYIYRTAISGL